MMQIHVIDHCFSLGAVNEIEEARRLKHAPGGFDHDGYKILCRPLLSGHYPIEPL
nr:Excinuclease cho [Candidatus Pantoea persica]